MELEQCSDALTIRDEIAEIEVLDDCFDMTIYLDYCSNLDEEIKPSQNINMQEDERMDNIEKTIPCILKIEPQNYISYKRNS